MDKEDKRRIDSTSERRLRRALLWFFGFVIVMGGAGFTFKLYEFFVDLTDADGLRFAGAHILTYILTAGGFVLLLVLAFMRGHFADIEKPKFDMLENERRMDRETFGYGDEE